MYTNLFAFIFPIVVPAVAVAPCVVDAIVTFMSVLTQQASRGFCEIIIESTATNSFCNDS